MRLVKHDGEGMPRQEPGLRRSRGGALELPLLGQADSRCDLLGTASGRTKSNASSASFSLTPRGPAYRPTSDRTLASCAIGRHAEADHLLNLAAPASKHSWHQSASLPIDARARCAALPTSNSPDERMI